MPKAYVKLEGAESEKDMREKPQPASMDSWRIVIFGESGVGKTTLARQFAHGLHQDYHDPTGSDNSFRKLLIVDNRRCFIEVIDTEGHSDYAVLRGAWAREGQAYLLVYDITSRASFEALDAFRQTIACVRPEPICVLVGNKADRTHDRAVASDEGAQLAQKLGFGFLETSARTASNVERVFIDTVRALRLKQPVQRRQDFTRKRGKRCTKGCAIV